MSDKTTDQIQNTPQFIWSGAVAFLAAVSTAALTMEIILCIRLIIGSFESATGNSLATKVEDLLTLSAVTYILEWIWAFIFSIIPFSIGFYIAQRKKLFTRSFFVTGGAITGGVLSLLGASMPNLGINVEGDVGEYVIHQFIIFLPCFTVSGVVAGLTCWMVLKRFDGKVSGDSALGGEQESV